MEGAVARRRLVIACAFALALATLGGAGTSRGQAADTEPSVAALRICTNCVSTGGDLSRYRYVVLNAWDYAQIPTLKARNPGIKVFVYKNASASYAYACHNGVDDALLPAGVGYCDAAATHPAWFLTDTTGSRVQFCDYPGTWQMDVGSATYQDAWLSNVSNDLASHGWDGVMIDDVNSSERYHLCGKTLASYPTDTDYEAAMRSFLARIGPTLMSRGFTVLPNINYDCWETCFSNFIQYTSGAVREWWTKNGTGYAGQYNDSGWDWSDGFLRLAQSQGKIFVGITYGPSDDLHSQRYARASFLLDWDGGPSALTYQPNPETTDPWNSDWTMSIGTPTGARYLVGSVWRRAFSAGTVLVNPSASTSATVSLGGSFTMPDGSTVTSVTLGPTSGLILRSVGAAPPPPPPPPPPSPVAAPVNTAPPSIVILQGGWSVSGTAGTWTGTPTFRYQWTRCDSKGSACVAISGANSTGYQPTAVDAGSTLRFQVTATNAAGSVSAASAPTTIASSSSKNSKPRAAS